MFTIICVCIFVTNYVNAYHNNNQNNNEVAKTVDPNDDKIIRKMLAYFQESSWAPLTEEDLVSGAATHVIQIPTKNIYRIDIRLEQKSHPYLYRLIETIQNKGQISSQLIYEKLFKIFKILQQQTTSNKITKGTIIKILQYVFPELGTKIYDIAKYPTGPPIMRAILEMVMPHESKLEINKMFNNASTTKELIINIVLYLCPNIRENFLWNENSSIDIKLQTILKILFPGNPDSNFSAIFNAQYGFQAAYAFLEALFSGKLIPVINKDLSSENSEWYHFLEVLHQYRINYQTLSNEVLWYLYANFKTPQFHIYVISLKEKLEEEEIEKLPGMNNTSLQICMQFLNDLRAHPKSLNEIKLYLQQYENPQDFIRILSYIFGFQIDETKLQLNSQIKNLWKKFLFDTGDITYFLKKILAYFKSISNNPHYLEYLDLIFNSATMNSKIDVKWNAFFKQLQYGSITLDQMPPDLIAFLIKQKHPKGFLQFILKLIDPNFDISLLNVDINNSHIVQLWQQFIQNVAINKLNIKNIPTELLNYFFRISDNPTYITYLKLLFGLDKIKPQTLDIWNHFITGLQSHRIELQDMPSEIIHLMLKYKSPDELVKIFLPERNHKVNTNLVPDEIVRNQWIQWTYKVNHGTLEEIPQELLNYFYQKLPSKDNQTSINQINPILLQNWNLFMINVRKHTASLFTMTHDLWNYIRNLKSPKEFIIFIFKGLGESIINPIATPSEGVISEWNMFQNSITVVGNKLVFKGLKIHHNLMKYLFSASTNANYKTNLYHIFQMDVAVKTEMEKFRQDMKNDYNVSLDSIPEKICTFIEIFEHPADLIRSILAAYPGYYEIKVPKIYESSNFMIKWAIYTKAAMENHEILPELKTMLHALTQNTPMQDAIEELFKIHETNKLVSQFENILGNGIKHLPIYNGRHVFVGTLQKLADYYKELQESCQENDEIVNAFYLLSNRYSGTFTCSYDSSY